MFVFKNQARFNFSGPRTHWRLVGGLRQRSFHEQHGHKQMRMNWFRQSSGAHCRLKYFNRILIRCR